MFFLNRDRFKHYVNSFVSLLSWFTVDLDMVEKSLRDSAVYEPNDSDSDYRQLRGKLVSVKSYLLISFFNFSLKNGYSNLNTQCFK